MADIPSLKMFLSSPGDVGREREMAHRVIRRLNEQFSNRVRLEPYFWEHEPMRATQDFQQQIPEPASFDIVICILWSRLGTRLHASHTRADGTTYSSGTEYEFENAAEAAMKKGTPELMVYWNQKPPLIPLKPKEVRDEMTRQFDALEAFVQKWFFDHEDKGTLKAAFNTYEDLADFEEKLEVHLAKLIEDKYPATSGTATPAATWKQGSPFRGLEVFDFEHEEIFFGRTTAIGEILEALRKRTFDKEPAFLLVQGNSGVGKSSVVRAGVLPLLMKPGVVEGVGVWRRATMRPAEASGNPALSLARALVADPALPELTADGTTVEYLAELLESNPENAFLLIKGALSQVGQKIALEENLEKQPVTKLVLLVDQFEEIFTTEDLTPKNRESLVAVLRSLANSGLVWVIATMRSDFFHRCDEIPALVELKSGLGQYQLVPPSPAEISQIIRKPAQIAGLRFEVDSKTGEQLDDLLRDAAVRNPASLPLLEFCLDELYQRRSDQNVLTLESYKEMGGVEGALAQRAEEAFGRVSPDAQNQFDTVFRQLVTVTPGEESSVTRRTEPLETFSAQPGQKELVDALTKDRLLVSGANDAGQPVVSVAHEALLRSWPRLHSWIESSMEFFRERFRLEYSLNRWRDEGQTDELLLREGKPLASAEALVNQWRDYLKAEEIDYVERSAAYHHARAQRRIRRLQVTIAGVAVLAILAAISSIFAFQQQREAVAAAEEAEKQKTLAEDAAEEARRQEGIAKAQTLKSQETTLQILEGNFRLAFENKDYDSALNWLEEAKTTARQVGRPTETYEIWQATLLPRVNQVEWEIPFAARFNCVVTSGDGSETFFLVNDQFYRLFFEGDGSPRVEALQFDHRVRTVDSFVVDHRNRRLIYSDEEQLFAYAFEAGGEAVQLMDGLNGGIFMTEDQEAIWFVRNLNLEIWSPDMETRLASYPYPHVENGYVYIGVLDREKNQLIAKLGVGDDRLILATNYETGEILHRQERQGAYFRSLVKAGEFYLSTGSGGDERTSRICLFPVDDPSRVKRILTPWHIMNVVDWDSQGFRVVTSEGVVQRWNYAGELLDSSKIPGLASLYHLIQITQGFLYSSSNGVLVHDSLQPPEESVALRPKPASRSLLVHETPYSETGAAQLWGLSPDYLDRIDPRSGRVLASIQLEAEQVALSPFNQTLVTHRDGVLRAWQHPDYSGSLTDLEEIEGFHPESRLTVLSEAEVTGAGVERIAFLDPNTLLVETGDGLYLYDANPLRPRHRLTQTKPFAVQQMGEFLIAAFVDEARDRLEFRTYWGPEFEMSEPVFLDRVEPDNLAVVDFDRGGDWIWIGTKDGRVLLADLGRDMEAYGSLLDAVSEIGAPEDDTLLDNSAVMEVFQLEGGAIEGLHTGGNRLAIVTEDGTLRICQISPEGKGTLQFTLYPFPSSIPDQLVFLSPGGSESSERILLKNGSGGLFSLALGRDDRFQTEADHRFGMGRGANTGDFIVYPRGTSIEARSIQPGSTSTRLQPGRDNVGEGGFNALVTNPSMNRFVSYSNGRLFTWSKEGGRFLSEPFTQTLVSGIFGSSMRFIDDHHLVVGSPGAGSPVIMLVRYEADGKDASVQFSAPLGEIRIQGDPGSSGSPDTLTNLAPRYVAGNADFLFFGDDKADEVWQIDMKARTAKRLRLASPPRRLEVVGEGRDILAVSHEGYVSLHQAGSLEPRGRVDFPLIGIEGEDFYIREMLAIPGTDFFLSGYKGSIQLVNAAKAERIRDFPVNGYVWSIHLAPDQSAIHYISEIGQGTIPFSDLGQDPGRYGGFRKKGQSRTGQTTLFSNQPEVRIHE